MRAERRGRASEHGTQVLVEADAQRDAPTSGSEIARLEAHCRTSEVETSFDGEPPQLTVARSLKEYAALVSRKRCRWCGTRLKKWVEHYDHGGGWEVSGFSQKQWLYTTCPRCKYQWNLSKLGITK